MAHTDRVNTVRVCAGNGFRKTSLRYNILRDRGGPKGAVIITASHILLWAGCDVIWPRAVTGWVDGPMSTLMCHYVYSACACSME